MEQVDTKQTHDDRSASMRARLRRATLDTILKHGYAHTTLVAIVKEAGVTRGAAHHHYTSKDEMIIDAFTHLLKEASAEIREFARAAQGDSISLNDFLQQVWGVFSGSFFMLSLEHITAARRNTILRKNLIRIIRDFHLALDETWNSFFIVERSVSAEQITALNATLCLFRGMGLQTIIRDDPAYYQRLLTFWNDVLTNHTRVSLRTKNDLGLERAPNKRVSLSKGAQP